MHLLCSIYMYMYQKIESRWYYSYCYFIVRPENVKIESTILLLQFIILLLQFTIYFGTFFITGTVCNGSTGSPLLLPDPNACDCTKKAKGNSYNATN